VVTAGVCLLQTIITTILQKSWSSSGIWEVCLLHLLSSEEESILRQDAVENRVEESDAAAICRESS
jgi:hypothetical protein